MGGPARRALVSVSDKSGVDELARGLVAMGFEVVSTGNTLRALTEAGVPATAVADVTGFPEILGGRVKTLHPAVHGGVLAMRTPEHLAELAEHGITPVDLVVANLYPFRETVAREGVTDAEAIEQIDIGGPAMIRAAAKNHEHVVVVVDPADYATVPAELEAGMEPARRRALALKAFAHTAAYDAAIVAYLQRGERLPGQLRLPLERAQELRYGENPHQVGARYRTAGESGVWDSAVQHSGPPLSYLNVFDADAAWRLAHELPEVACVIVKHANACGAAVADDLLTAYERAFAADPKSAFGGVVALPGTVDLRLAERVAANPKSDVLLARGYDEDALALLAARRKSTRVLALSEPGPAGLDLRRVDGGFLVQEPDAIEDPSGWKVVSARRPNDREWRDLEVAYRVCAHTSSNAIVLVKDGVAVGVGAGQQSRVDAVEIAARKADGRASGGACASDAFFPFRDGLDAAAAAGVAAVVQPGGSIRDDEIIAAADELGLAMVMTGHRHFKH